MNFLKSITKKTEEIPLTDIIGIAMNKITFNEFKENIEKGKSNSHLKPVANNKLAKYHREKILREEATKQFPEYLRPTIEFIGNAIDSKPDNHKGDYIIDVNVSRNSFTVRDKGTGMSLDKILTTLLIPFSSDKDEKKDLGRFGVGVFSGLGFCLLKPNSSRVKISTAQGTKGYKLDFSAKSKETKDLVTSIKKAISFKTGTTIDVNFKCSRRELVPYINKYLNFFEADRAKIRVNKKIINNTDLQSSRIIYYVPVKLENGTETSCRLAIEKTDKKGSSSLYSQGVFVKEEGIPFYNIKLDMPSEVLLVEGRDEFKQDENYYSAWECVFDFVCKNKQKIIDDIDTEFDINEFLISLVEVSDLPKWKAKAAIKQNIDSLFGKDSFIVRDFEKMSTLMNLRDFFGDDIVTNIYAPQTEVAYRFWKEILPDHMKFIELNTEYTYENEDEIRKNSPALVHLKKEFTNNITYFNIVRLKKQTETRSPFIGKYDCIKINKDHPMLQEDSFLSKYMASAYLMRQIHGEKNADEKLINQEDRVGF